MSSKSVQKAAHWAVYSTLAIAAELPDTMTMAVSVDQAAVRALGGTIRVSHPHPNLDQFLTEVRRARGDAA